MDFVRVGWPGVVGGACLKDFQKWVRRWFIVTWGDKTLILTLILTVVLYSVSPGYIDDIIKHNLSNNAIHLLFSGMTLC